jgi:hypothetical protein
MFKIFGKQCATAVHIQMYMYLINSSEMIFIVLSAKLFQAIFLDCGVATVY